MTIIHSLPLGKIVVYLISYTNRNLRAPLLLDHRDTLDPILPIQWTPVFEIKIN